MAAAAAEQTRFIADQYYAEPLAFAIPELEQDIESRRRAAAFIGAKPEGMHVNHIDGDKTNNATTNLEYVTRKGNMEHAARTGLMVRGATHHQSKLTPATVVQLRQDQSAGMSYSKLAAKYGVSIATAFNAAKGNNWNHVE